MVATVDEIVNIVRSNPFIDGIGYFIEVTTAEEVDDAATKDLTKRVQDAFCAHAQVTREGDDVLGLDFHEHIFTHGDGAEDDLKALQTVLRYVEATYGIEHLCIELQFDLGRAKKAKKQVDELLRP